MDFASLDLSKNSDITAVMKVLHPVTQEPMINDQDVEVSIELKGMESAVAKRMMKARAQRQMNSRKKIDFEEAQQFSCTLLAALIVKSTGIIENGVEVDLSDKQTAADFLSRYSWLREQIDEFVMDRANFFNA